MIVVDASVAVKWFVTSEPLVEEAGRVLGETADARAARRVSDRDLVSLLGS